MTNVVRPGHDLVQRALDLLLGRRVDGRRRVVEDEDPRVGEQRARDRDPLALAAAQRQPALADARVVAVGQRRDEVVRLRALGGRDDLLARGLVAPRVGDVLVHGRAEEERVVGDDGDLAAQRARVDVAHVDAVDEHGAGRDVVQARDERDERRLARAGRADERERRAGVDRQRDVAQRGLGRRPRRRASRRAARCGPSPAGSGPAPGLRDDRAARGRGSRRSARPTRSRAARARAACRRSASGRAA